MSHEVQGRGLELKKNLDNVNPSLNPDGMKSSINIEGPAMKNDVAIPSRVFRSLEGYVDGFRPTTPGHSPGVGHSIVH